MHGSARRGMVGGAKSSAEVIVGRAGAARVCWRRADAARWLTRGAPSPKSYSRSYWRAHAFGVDPPALLPYDSVRLGRVMRAQGAHDLPLSSGEIPVTWSRLMMCEVVI